MCNCRDDWKCREHLPYCVGCGVTLTNASVKWGSVWLCVRCKARSVVTGWMPGQSTEGRVEWADVFVECDSCRAKVGSLLLCRGCIHNRTVIARLTSFSYGHGPLYSEFIDAKVAEDHPREVR